MSGLAPLVSVVVPTFERPQLLARCLRALLAQHLSPDSFEIVVVHDGPGPETRVVVESLRDAGGCHKLRYLELAQHGGPAAARNLGWQSASGAVIAFTDDDCIPAPEWLSEGMQAMAEGVAGASGRVIVPLTPRPTDYQRNLTGLQRSLFVTANCFYARAALAEAGGFDERFETAWREDTDLYLTLLERGRVMVEARSAVVIHPARPAPWGISLKEQRKSLYNALLYKKHPDSYRRLVQSLPPLSYYASIACILAATASLAAGAQLPAVISLLAWSFLTLRFCLSRLAGNSLKPGHIAEMAVTSALIPLLSVYWRLRGALRYRVLFL